jgi:putative transcriptional regulator
VFAGYAAWAPGQLQNELKREGWTILPADSATIFDKDAAAIWPELSKRAVLRPTVSNISQ